MPQSEGRIRKFSNVKKKGEKIETINLSQRQENTVGLPAKNSSKLQSRDFLQFNELPRAICTSDGPPNKGQKSNALKFYKKRYDTVITCIYPPSWEPGTIILEGMFLINSSPLYDQHKTFLDYAIFLVSIGFFHICQEHLSLKKSMCYLTILKGKVIIQNRQRDLGGMDLHFLVTIILQKIAF